MCLLGGAVLIVAVMTVFNHGPSVPRISGPESPSTNPTTEFDSRVSGIVDSVDLQRVDVLLAQRDGSATDAPLEHWPEIERIPCGRFCRLLMIDPLAHGAEVIARSCEFNPEDRPLSASELESLRSLIDCFRPAIEHASRLVTEVEVADLTAAYRNKQGRRFGELPPCTDEQAQRAKELIDAAFQRTARQLEDAGVPYDATMVRLSEAEHIARTLDSDRGQRMMFHQFDGPDGRSISIDLLPRVSEVHEVSCYQVWSMARSLASWFQSRGILDTTRGMQLEQRMDSIWSEMRSYIGSD